MTSINRVAQCVVLLKIAKTVTHKAQKASWIVSFPSNRLGCLQPLLDTSQGFIVRFTTHFRLKSSRRDYPLQ